MKILHTSDLHLGKKLCDFNLIEEQKFKLNQIIDYVKNNNVRAVILAGDIFDTSVSTEEAIKLFNNFLATLLKIDNVDVFVISGNHDSRVRLGNKELFDLLNNRIHFYTSIDDISKYQIDNVAIYAIPFLRLEDIERKFDKSFENLDEGFLELFKSLYITKDTYNICISHQAVLPKKGKLERSNSENNFDFIGGEETINSTTYKDFDYVALGHIHKPQTIEKNKIYYSGSIYKYHYNEGVQERHFIVLDTETNAIEYIKFKNIHDVKIIEGSLEKLKTSSSDDYVKIIVEDDNNHDENILAILKPLYPNHLGIINKKDFLKMYCDYSSISTEEVKQLQSLSKYDYFKKFFETMKQETMDKETEEICQKLFNGEDI